MKLGVLRRLWQFFSSFSPAAVGMCVCMCVMGLRVNKEATGLGREGERDACRRETDGILTNQQIVAAACPAAGREGLRGE